MLSRLSMSLGSYFIKVPKIFVGVCVSYLIWVGRIKVSDRPFWGNISIYLGIVNELENTTSNFTRHFTCRTGILQLYIAFTGILRDKTMDDILNIHHWREMTCPKFLK